MPVVIAPGHGGLTASVATRHIPPFGNGFLAIECYACALSGMRLSLKSGDQYEQGRRWNGPRETGARQGDAVPKARHRSTPPMRSWGHKRRKADELDAQDDGAVDRLLNGHYRGDAPELLATSQLVEEVRSLATEPVPRPSAELARILDGTAPSSDAVSPSTGTTSNLRGQRPRVPRVPTAAAAVSLALAGVILVAGYARLLPGPAQDLMAAIVNAITPFEFPQQREPDAVLARSRAPAASPSTERAPGTPGALPPGHGEPESTGDHATSGNGSAGRPAPAAPARPAPATSTTVTPRPGPAIGGTVPVGTPTTGPAPGTGPGPPGPPLGVPDASRLRADLRGGQSAGGPVGHGSVALDSNPGKNELCLTLTVSVTAPVTSVHLHAASVGANGLVVATFTPPPAAGTSTTCVTVTDQLLKEVGRGPGNYYVDVHTLDLLNGTLRGQLTR